MHKPVRNEAIKILQSVLKDGKSLSQLTRQIKSHPETSFLQALVFGVIRHYEQLSYIANLLLSKKLKPKDQDVFLLILVGIYQLEYMNVADYAAINETVKVTKNIKKIWAKSLVNALLRNFQRERDDLIAASEEDESAKYKHPEWLIKKIKIAWPNDWQSILEANNQQAPMSLRVNQQKISCDDYLKKLLNNDIQAKKSEFCEDALTLEKPCDVFELPGFKAGECFVQGISAQLAADLATTKANRRLDRPRSIQQNNEANESQAVGECSHPSTLQKTPSSSGLTAGSKVLDACAAPGGKTTHLLEKHPGINLTAIDCEPERVERIKENLKRLNLKAKVICQDVLNIDKWFDGEPFDFILLDAPCSATGVIRRHPDIKILRREEDIEALSKIQGEMLAKLWSLLKPGGTLLYATCSILPEENTAIAESFLSKEKTAVEIEFDVPWGVKQAAGRQIISGQDDMDGFYYCFLEKSKT